MQRALFYTFLGICLSFVMHYFLFPSGKILLDLFYAVCFGVAWGFAYYLDNPSIVLLKKMSVSFLAMGILVGIGALLFTLPLAIPGILKFSTVFVAYYLIASFRSNKSLRS